MIKKISIFSIVLLMSISLYSQSVFSFYGPAETSFSRDAIGEGMGATGSGDLFRRNTGFINPSLSTSIDRTNFSTALSLGNVKYKDNDGLSFKDDQAFMSYFNIVVPIKQHRFAFHYNTISSGRLNTERATQITYPNSDTPVNLIEEQKIDFSIYRASVFYANKNNILNFGVGISYLFGHRIHFSKQDFESSDYIDARFEEESTFKNPSLNIGVSKMINNFSFGLAGNLPAKLKGDTYVKTNTLNQKTANSTFEFPAQLHLGLTYKPSELFTVSSDMDFEQWAKTNNFENSENSVRLALGLSWDAFRNDDNYFKNIPLRVGISHRNLPFKVYNSTVNELAYHFGISLPLKQYDSYLDFALKLYSRGDASKHLYEDSGFLLTIGTQGFDFLRKPVDRRAPRDIPKPDRGIF